MQIIGGKVLVLLGERDPAMHVVEWVLLNAVLAVSVMRALALDGGGVRRRGRVVEVSCAFSSPLGQ